MDISIVKINITSAKVTAEISDGRIVSVPMSWFPKLDSASLNQLQNFEISTSGSGVHWPDLNEDISLKSFIS